jgi:hypothetical protein
MTPGRVRSPTAFAASSLYVADRDCAMDEEEQSQRVRKVCTQRRDSW